MTTFSRPVIVGSTAADCPASAMSRRTAAGLRATSMPWTRSVPAVRTDQGRDEVDEGRLAGAVRTEQRHDLARLHREVQPVQRMGLAERLDEVGCLQGRVHL